VAAEPPEERFGKILDQLGEGIVVSDRYERHLYVNQAMADLLGYSREELLEKRSFDLVPEGETVLLEKELQKRERGETSRYSIDLVARSGGRIPVQVAATPLPSGGSVAIFVDMREQLRQLERIAELRSQDLFLARILRDSVDAIVSLDADQIIRGWNRGAELVFGYTSAEVLGKHISILHPPESAYEKDAEYVASVIAEKGYLRDYQTQRLAKGERSIPVSITVSAVRGEQGEIVGLSAIYRDISTFRKWEKEITDEFQRLKGVYVELGRRGRQLESILDMIDLLQDDVTLNSVTASLASHLAVMTKAQLVLVLLLTTEDKLHVQEAIGAGREWHMLPDIPLRDSIFEECLQRGAPHRIHNIATSPGFRWRRLARKEGLRFALLLPLVVPGKKYGVAMLSFIDDQPYRSMHESYPEHLSKVGAMVLHLSVQRGSRTSSSDLRVEENQSMEEKRPKAGLPVEAHPKAWANERR
jgi:PAS domain S-box-containing protein